LTKMQWASILLLHCLNELPFVFVDSILFYHLVETMYDGPYMVMFCFEFRSLSSLFAQMFLKNSSRRSLLI
jgi:hypothetical protein